MEDIRIVSLGGAVMWGHTFGSFSSEVVNFLISKVLIARNAAKSGRTMYTYKGRAVNYVYSEEPPVIAMIQHDSALRMPHAQEFLRTVLSAYTTQFHADELAESAARAVTPADGSQPDDSVNQARAPLLRWQVPSVDPVTRDSFDTAFAELLTQARKKYEEEFVQLPEEPQSPDPDECCGDGCTPCVYDRYDMQVEQYQELKKNTNLVCTAISAWLTKLVPPSD